MKMASGVDSIIRAAAEKLQLRELKDKQLEAIRAFLNGHDVFLSVPTGYGKSIVYGILPFVFDIMKGRLHAECLLYLYCNFRHH